MFKRIKLLEHVGIRENSRADNSRDLRRVVLTIIANGIAPHLRVYVKRRSADIYDTARHCYTFEDTAIQAHRAHCAIKLVKEWIFVTGHCSISISFMNVCSELHCATKRIYTSTCRTGSQSIHNVSCDRTAP